jgi:hypothetical protein
LLAVKNPLIFWDLFYNIQRMSGFKNSFAKPLRWSLFFFINFFCFVAIIGFIGFKNRKRYNALGKLLQKHYKRFIPTKNPNTIRKEENLAFRDIQVVEKDNHWIIYCVLLKKIDNYYLLINQISQKIKNLDSKYEIHCSNVEENVHVQIFPILDKEDIKKIIDILENILLS